MLDQQRGTAMASVAVAGREEVHQVGDVTINQRTDLVYVEDGENATLLEKRTTVAEIPQEDGTTAVLAGVEFTVRASGQPMEQELGEPRKLIFLLIHILLTESRPNWHCIYHANHATNTSNFS